MTGYKPSDLATILTFHPQFDDPIDLAIWIDERLLTFSAEATLAEQEACEKVADERRDAYRKGSFEWKACNRIAAAIRSRSAMHDVEGERG